MTTSVEISLIKDPDALVSQLRSSFAVLGYPQLANICCEADGSTVYLTGILSSFYLKQVAQTITLKLPGVGNVVNDIEVTSIW